MTSSKSPWPTLGSFLPTEKKKEGFSLLSPFYSIICGDGTEIESIVGLNQRGPASCFPAKKKDTITFFCYEWERAINNG